MCSSDLIFAICSCGWTSGARITVLSASALFQDHQREAELDPTGQVEPDDLVQLDPEKCGNPMLAGCIMVVTEVKAWGVQGYVQACGQEGKPGGQAYYRAKWDEVQKVGRAYWVVK